MSLIEPYYTWKRRKILVYNFEQPNSLGRDSIAESLRSAQIPHEEMNFYSHDHGKWNSIKETLIGIIFTGSHSSVDAPFCPYVPSEILEYDIPKLGICYGHELLGKILGSEIIKCNNDIGEKMDCIAELEMSCFLFEGLNSKEIVPMRHNNMLRKAPRNSRIIASTQFTPIAGFELKERNIWGLQFHPEKNYLYQNIFGNFANYCYKLFHSETIMQPK